MEQPSVAHDAERQRGDAVELATVREISQTSDVRHGAGRALCLEVALSSLRCASMHLMHTRRDVSFQRWAREATLLWPLVEMLPARRERRFCWQRSFSSAVRHGRHCVCLGRLGWEAVLNPRTRLVAGVRRWRRLGTPASLDQEE